MACLDEAAAYRIQLSQVRVVMLNELEFAYSQVRGKVKTLREYL